jgi:hypothetical protein
LLTLCAALPQAGMASSWIECRFEVEIVAFDGQRFELEAGSFRGADGGVTPSEAECRQLLPVSGALATEVADGAEHLARGRTLQAIWSSYSGMGPQGLVEDRRWRFAPPQER